MPHRGAGVAPIFAALEGAIIESKVSNPNSCPITATAIL